jgi:uncharacterized membrane protein
MSAVLAGLFAAIGLAAFGATIAMTVRSYPRLPAQVPYHFDIYGNPDQFGPRPMVYITPFGFFLAFVIWAFVMLSTGFNDASGVAVTGGIIDFVLIAGFFLQRGILSVAEGKAEQMHPFAFWKN